MAKGPSHLRIRSYQVGFGDCFLLSFTYASGPRHVLIDFGSTGLPDGTGSDQLRRIADDIKSLCKSKLHAVVATHRHMDHISGFATAKNGKGPGDVIRALSPDVVVQPWTEDPKARKDAKKPTAISSANGKTAFVAMLDRMHGVAELGLDFSSRLRDNKSLAGELAFLGEDNLANLSAVKNLMTMGKRNFYVHAGSKSGLETVLPGVKVHVLGPPTLEQSDAIRQQRREDQNEFWHLHALSARRANGFDGSKPKLLFPRADIEKSPPYARWMQRRLREIRGEELLGLVRILDKQMNNTSVILLFEIGSKKLLFSGDAQLENWQYTIANPDAKKTARAKALLADVDLYKVGHHGSLNATPKTLWGWFDRKGGKTKRGRLESLLSTMPHKHGTESKGTEVPRSKLVTALRDESDLHSTLGTQGLHQPDLGIAF